MFNYRKTYLYHSIIFFLPLLFITDGVSKALSISGYELDRISLLFRMLFEFTVIIYLMNYLLNKTYILLIFLLLAFFLLSNFIILEFYFFENFIYFNKFIFIFIVYMYFSDLLILNKNKFYKIYSLFEYIIYCNFFLIVIGFIFNIEYFKTFGHMDYRFGYNGVFLAGNESSFVLIIMLSFLYFKSYYENENSIYFWICSFISLLCGMKAVYIFLILLMLFHFFQNIKKRNFIIVIVLFILAYDYLATFINSDSFQVLIEFFKRVSEEKGFLYMLMGGRQDFIEDRFLVVLTDWNYINYFIGGNDMIENIIEMDFLDLFLFFGLLGFILYNYMFFKMFLSPLIKHKFFLFFLSSIIILSFFGGHFLTSPTSAIYFSLVIVYFKNYRKQKYENDIINK